MTENGSRWEQERNVGGEVPATADEVRAEWLGKFAGRVAHDFNNVLASITTLLHLLGEQTKAE